ncbi:MAG TPA: polysaccharide deacetylase family protein [Telmatospirillum sp.]|nr:polysaccharide deacetylase family protein [Telmatospirillum sp.]
MCCFRHAAPLLAILLSGALPGATLAATPEVLDFNTISHEERISRDCAITFDDGPGPHTAQLLDLLADRQIKATFFVLGEHVRLYPDLIRRMVSAGHEVENHSWDHPDMRKLDERARQREIEDTVALLKTLGVTPHFFRPPYGSYDTALVDLAHRDGLEVVLWTHDSVDWRYHTVAQLEGDILPRGEGAHGVFLFHDIHDSTIAAMPAILDELKSKGCHFTTVAEWTDDSNRLRASATGAISPPPASPAPPVNKDIGLKRWLKALW